MTLEGASALRARLGALQHLSGRESQIVSRWQLATIREAKILVPRKTGNLGRSIHFLRGETGGGPTGVVYASANYAAYVEFGTRAHNITPRAKKALRWASGAGATRLSGSPRGRYDASHKPVSALAKSIGFSFAKRVHHPGTSPHPFLAPAAKFALQQVGAGGQIFVEAWNSAA